MVGVKCSLILMGLCVAVAFGQLQGSGYRGNQRGYFGFQQFPRQLSRQDNYRRDNNHFQTIHRSSPSFRISWNHGSNNAYRNFMPYYNNHNNVHFGRNNNQNNVHFGRNNNQNNAHFDRNNNQNNAHFDRNNNHNNLHFQERSFPSIRRNFIQPRINLSGSRVPSGHISPVISSAGRRRSGYGYGSPVFSSRTSGNSPFFFIQEQFKYINELKRKQLQNTLLLQRLLAQTSMLDQGPITIPASIPDTAIAIFATDGDDSGQFSIQTNGNVHNVDGSSFGLDFLEPSLVEGTKTIKYAIGGAAGGLKTVDIGKVKGKNINNGHDNSKNSNGHDNSKNSNGHDNGKKYDNDDDDGKNKGNGHYNGKNGNGDDNGKNDNGHDSGKNGNGDDNGKKYGKNNKGDGNGKVSDKAIKILDSSVTINKVSELDASVGKAVGSIAVKKVISVDKVVTGSTKVKVVPVVTGSNVIVPVVTGSNVIVPVVTGSKVIAPVVTGSNVIVPVVTGSKVIVPDVTGSKVIAPVVTASKSIAPVVTGSKVIAPVVTGSNVIVPVVTGSKFIAPVVTGSKVIAPVAKTTIVHDVHPEQKLVKVVPVLTKKSGLKAGAIKKG